MQTAACGSYGAWYRACRIGFTPYIVRPRKCGLKYRYYLAIVLFSVRPLMIMQRKVFEDKKHWQGGGENIQMLPIDVDQKVHVNARRCLGRLVSGGR